MPADDKRKFLRMGAFLEGTFETLDGIEGLIMLVNFSKEGVRASLNREIEKGEKIKMEIGYPGSIIPIFATGQIMWIKDSEKEWTYTFDAGIKLLEINPSDRRRLLDYAYEHWVKSKGKT